MNEDQITGNSYFFKALETTIMIPEQENLILVRVRASLNGIVLAKSDSHETIKNLYFNFIASVFIVVQ